MQKPCKNLSKPTRKMLLLFCRSRKLPLHKKACRNIQNVLQRITNVQTIMWLLRIWKNYWKMKNIFISEDFHQRCRWTGAPTRTDMSPTGQGPATWAGACPRSDPIRKPSGKLWNKVRGRGGGGVRGSWYIHTTPKKLHSCFIFHRKLRFCSIFLKFSEKCCILGKSRKNLVKI